MEKSLQWHNHNPPFFPQSELQWPFFKHRSQSPMAAIPYCLMRFLLKEYGSFLLNSGLMENLANWHSGSGSTLPRAPPAFLFLGSGCRSRADLLEKFMGTQKFSSENRRTYPCTKIKPRPLAAVTSASTPSVTKPPSNAFNRRRPASLFEIRNEAATCRTERPSRNSSTACLKSGGRKSRADQRTPSPPSVKTVSSRASNATAPSPSTQFRSFSK